MGIENTGPIRGVTAVKGLITYIHKVFVLQNSGCILGVAVCITGADPGGGGGSVMIGKDILVKHG